MKSAGNVRFRDKGHKSFIVSQFVESEAFAHVAIDVYSHKRFFPFQEFNEENTR